MSFVDNGINDDRDDIKEQREPDVDDGVKSPIAPPNICPRPFEHKNLP